MKIQIKVIPRSSKNSVEKIDETHYKVKVTAVPEKGRANDMVIKTLADYFKIKKYQITIISGTTIPDKIVEIIGLD